MSTYDYIKGKIQLLKDKYPSLRQRADDYVFSALCVEANFYKNPALILNKSDFAEMIVDGWSDGGADILLSDPNSEDFDFVIGQSKFYKSISQESVLNALLKMARFYNGMTAGHYERVNAHVQRRFITLNAEMSNEAKICFVFYTSAPQPKNFDLKRVENEFRKQFADVAAIDVKILFADDIKNQIEEWASRKPTVERGQIKIDDKDNYLLYGDNAVIVNVSAFSIKELYGLHNIALLSRNLRYHIKGGKLDSTIRKTIKDAPETFWLKNNGITIICDSFKLDGVEVKLTNFSIVNGGQTTYLLSKSKITAANDLWLPCKIIKTRGDTEDEKSAFSLEIATAANSQKAIKPADLKANAPEQIRFAKAMREIGVLYQTKRGEEIKAPYTENFLHTKLEEVGKLCLAAIFQEPCKSRTNPSAAYKDNNYYGSIFNGNQAQVAAVCKELLYINDYFNAFLKKFEDANKDAPEIKNFARNAQRICVAFTALAARYHQGNITDEKLTAALNSAQTDLKKVEFYNVFSDIGEMKFLLPIKLNTEAYNVALTKLFKAIIRAGIKNYSIERRRSPNLTVRNFSLSDKNYYEILSDHWDTLRDDINEIFQGG